MSQVAGLGNGARHGAVAMFEQRIEILDKRLNFGGIRAVDPVAGTVSDPHQPGTDRYVGAVIVDMIDVGTWRRTVKGQKLIMELALAPDVGPEQREAVEAEATRLARFLDKELLLR